LAPFRQRGCQAVNFLPAVLFGDAEQPPPVISTPRRVRKRNAAQNMPLLKEVQEIYGYERLDAQLCKKPYQNAATTVKELLEAVAAYVGEAPASDDLTVLCLEVHPCRENER